MNCEFGKLFKSVPKDKFYWERTKVLDLRIILHAKCVQVQTWGFFLFLDLFARFNFKVAPIFSIVIGFEKKKILHLLCDFSSLGWENMDWGNISY